MAKNNANSNYVPRFKELYNSKIKTALVEEFEYKNVMEVPKLLKISINKGIGAASTNKKLLDDSIKEIRLITGQHPVTKLAKKSVSNFKLREGMPVGVHVTLRGDKMYEFMDRLITLALPRVRDFRGISDKSFDGRGNYSIGVKEQIIFPEIDIDKIPAISGFDVTFVTTAKTDEEAFALLKGFGMPFIRRDAA